MRQKVLGAFMAFLAMAGSPVAAADRVKVGVMNSSGDIGVFIARERGYFKEVDIELETTPFVSAAQMVAPLGIGDLDVGGGVVSAGLYNAADRKINIRVVADRGSTAPGYRYQSLMIRRDLMESGRYKGFADLKGLKISVPAPGITPQAVIAEAAQRGGIDYNEIEQIYMGMPQQVAAFQSKAIDGAIMIEPVATSLEKAGTAMSNRSPSTEPLSTPPSGHRSRMRQTTVCSSMRRTPPASSSYGATVVARPLRRCTHPPASNG